MKHHLSFFFSFFLNNASLLLEEDDRTSFTRNYSATIFTKKCFIGETRILKVSALLKHFWFHLWDHWFSSYFQTKYFTDFSSPTLKEPLFIIFRLPFMFFFPNLLELLHLCYSWKLGKLNFICKNGENPWKKRSHYSQMFLDVLSERYNDVLFVFTFMDCQPLPLLVVINLCSTYSKSKCQKLPPDFPFVYFWKRQYSHSNICAIFIYIFFLFLSRVRSSNL